VVPLGFERHNNMGAGAFSWTVIFSLIDIGPTFPFVPLPNCNKIGKTSIRADPFIYFFTEEHYGSGFPAVYPPGRSYR
ncbi:hypothetical protein, partial [Escherichia coli]|uniref:hypothetical protein n=1 Tax=Escherichia coli TaxID=562 RepID=UPI001BC8C653